MKKHFECCCGDRDHIIIGELTEYPEADNTISLRFVVCSRILTFWERIKSSTKILFGGYIDLEDEWLVGDQIGGLEEAKNLGEFLVDCHKYIVDENKVG